LCFSVPASVDEGEFGAQDLENIAHVRHREIPRRNGEPKGGGGRCQESPNGVMRITGNCDGVGYHYHISR
jgi:hypothetical protein